MYKRVTMWAAVLFCLSLMAGADQSDSSASTLALADASKVSSSLSFTWLQLKSGNAIFTIYNPTAKSQKIKASVEGLTHLPVGAASSGADLKVKIFPEQSEIQRFSLQKFTIKPLLPDEPPPGNYSGLIVIEVVDEPDKDKAAASARSATKRDKQKDNTKDGKEPRLAFSPAIMRLTVPGPQLLFNKVHMTSLRWWPGIWSDLEIPVPLTQSSTRPTDGSHALGAVTSASGDWTLVRWDPGTTKLVIDPPPAAGTYDGSFPVNDDPDKTAISMTVIAKDIVLWPILVIALGTCLAYLAKRYVGILRVSWQLREQEAELGHSLRQSQIAFIAGLRSAETQYSIDEGIEEAREKLRGLLDLIEKSPATTIDPNNATYKQAVSLLQTLQDSIASWAQFGSLLAALADPLQQIQASMRENGDIKAVPDFYESAQQLLTGKPNVDISNLPQLMTAVKDMTDLATHWKNAYQQTIKLQLEFENLQSGLKKTDNPHQEDVANLRKQFAVLQADLFAVSDASSMANVISADLTQVRGQLAQLQSTVATRFLVALSMSPAPVSEIRPLINLSLNAPALNLPHNDTRRAKLLIEMIHRADRKWTIFAGVIALLTGLNTFYLGKPFGTLQDYVTIFLWAAGTKVALDILSAVLDKIVVPGSMR